MFTIVKIIVGQGIQPEDAIELVEHWENTGEFQLLKRSKLLGNEIE